MKQAKKAASQRLTKDQRQELVLTELVDYYIRTGKPVGSKTLQEVGFPDLSSATIRNYFSNLEQEGFLKQLHTSAGRIPTDRAYRFYIEKRLASSIPTAPPLPAALHPGEVQEIAQYLQQAAELLSKQTQLAVFLSAPRFDHDCVTDIKAVRIDSHRCVCLLVTQFGLIQQVILHSPLKLSAFSTKRLESYFYWRLTGHNKPDHLDPEEEQLAQQFYHELMMRYIVNYSHFIDEEVYRTGFSHLLHYPDFCEAPLLANSLSLFENTHSLRLLLRACSSLNRLSFWIGEDLTAYSKHPPNCAVLAIPYHVNQTAVGAFGLFGPMRIPYTELFGILKGFSEEVGQTLTRSLYKFKISFRQPESPLLTSAQRDIFFLENSKRMLLENKH